MSVINIKETKAKKVSTNIKIKKFLIVRIHDIKPVPDFAARPTNFPSVASVCELDQSFSENIKKNQRCILYNYRVKSANKQSC